MANDFDMFGDMSPTPARSLRVALSLRLAESQPRTRTCQRPRASENVTDNRIFVRLIEGNVSRSHHIHTVHVALTGNIGLNVRPVQHVKSGITVQAAKILERVSEITATLGGTVEMAEKCSGGGYVLYQAGQRVLTGSFFINRNVEAIDTEIITINQALSTGAAMREGAAPRYAQLYFVGSERAVEARTEGNNLNPDIVRSLSELIEQNNPLFEYYYTALRSLQESEQQGSLRVVLNPEFRLIVEEHTDRRRYNLPTTNEVAVVIPDGADRNSRDVILFARNGDGTLSQRFKYIPHLYSGVMDALQSDRADQIGDPVILAASYVGGDRFIARCYQSAMEIARALENPSITQQTPDSQLDLIAKTFKLKLDQQIHDLKERYVCGVSTGPVYTIEYQKRGLPHAHILLFLHRDVVPRCAEQVDELVQAHVPTNDPELASIVKSLLVHGPCGPEFPNAPCMRDGKCSKGYPKRFCEQITMVENLYPEYEYPDNGVRWGIERFMFDNLWVIPYNPYLTKKYLVKYVYKRSDRATLQVPGQYDEIDMTLQGRYIGPIQAIWRLMAYATHEEKQAVMQLPYHLAEMAVQTRSSAFIDWMKYNDANADGRDLLYSDFPMHYTYVKNRGWHMRKKGHTNRRLPVAVSRQGEHFYLRSLLTIKRGARSYRDLYTVDATGHLRSTNRYIDPQIIWELFKDNFSDDCLYRIPRLRDELIMPPADWTDDERRYDYALWLLGNCLQDLGLDWERARLTRYRHAWVRQEQNALIAEALNYDREVERESFQDSQRLFSAGQRAAFDIITNTIDNGQRANTFFLQGPAGTGKTFLYKALCSLYRSQGKIVLCVASSGIASLLLLSIIIDNNHHENPIKANMTGPPNTNIDIDRENWEKIKIDPNDEETTATSINFYILWTIQMYREMKYRDSELWSMFKEDFEGWNEEMFKSADRRAVHLLRDYLRGNGVWVAKVNRITRAKMIQQILDDKEEHIWTESDIADALQDEERTGTVFNSYYNPRIREQEATSRVSSVAASVVDATTGINAVSPAYVPLTVPLTGCFTNSNAKGKGKQNLTWAPINNHTSSQVNINRSKEPESKAPTISYQPYDRWNPDTIQPQVVPAVRAIADLMKIYQNDKKY
ncbi:hypothetical protein EPUL_001157, partial [Erysiphe pulchra]